MTTEQVNKRIKIMGLRKSHVADKIGVKPSALSHYLNGNRGLTPEAKTALKNYLGL